MYGTAFLIAGLGVAVLTGLTFAPGPQSRQIALLVPPWQSDGLTQAAATGLPILDAHWRGHVILLDTGGDPQVLARLQAQGLWLLNADGTPLCDTPTKES